MVNKIKSCVFISGNGSNLKSLIKSSRDYNFPIKIELIISNNIKAKGLEFARKYNIPFKFFAYNSQEKFERNSLCEIKKRKIKFLCLAGFMKVLSENFIKNFIKSALRNFKLKTFLGKNLTSVCRGLFICKKDSSIIKKQDYEYWNFSHERHSIYQKESKSYKDFFKGRK